MVLGEAGVRVANGAEAFLREVVAAADVVDHRAGLDVEEETVDGEVAALGVLGGVGFEADGLGMAAVVIGSIAAEGGDFDKFGEYSGAADGAGRDGRAGVFAE